jgi:hypothetical protein
VKSSKAQVKNKVPVPWVAEYLHRVTYNFLQISTHLAVEKLLGLKTAMLVGSGMEHNDMKNRICRYEPLDRSTDSTVNDELGKYTNCSRDTKEDSVEVGFGETVVLEEDTGVGIDVGEGVLGFAVLSEDLGSNLVNLADKLEHGVVWHLLCKGWCTC